ncbi:MAG TPA: hypothetical protein VNT99_15765, partial [Methylomirabilota bacterium]|nr:hypothetical protein [Methylomirabilota bacterium]
FREDICILSFNYDPYLEYLLWTAHVTRKQAKGEQPDANVLDDVSSGFYQRSLIHRAEKNRLRVLKLHGICLLPTCSNQAPAISFHDCLLEKGRERLDERIAEFCGTMPPIIFPWELHTLSGRCDRKSFCLQDGMFFRTDSNLSYSTMHGDIYCLFEAIWKRAQVEISEAARISFVGMTMHDYLKPGLAQLFAARTYVINNPHYSNAANVEVVIANPDAVKPDTTMVRDYSEVLREACPRLATTIRTRRDFAEFIHKDMKPISAEQQSGEIGAAVG